MFGIAFGLAVNRTRDWHILLVVGAVLLAVEHIIGGYLNKEESVFASHLNQHIHSSGIQFESKFLILLGGIDCGVCGAVNQKIEFAVLLKEIVERIDVGDVKFGHIGKHIFIIGVFGR